VECSGCKSRITRVLHRCEQCLSCVNLCQSCYQTHTSLKVLIVFAWLALCAWPNGRMACSRSGWEQDGYWKHKRGHYRTMVTIAKQPNAKIMQLLQLYPATDKPTLHVR
jgi:hypothetical protein